MSEQIKNLTKQAQKAAKNLPQFSGQRVTVTLSATHENADGTAKKNPYQSSVKFGNGHPYEFIDGDHEESMELALYSLLGRIKEHAEVAA